MTLIDWLVVLLYLVLVALSKVGISAISLACLVIVIIIERILFGERFPVRSIP